MSSKLTRSATGAPPAPGTRLMHAIPYAIIALAVLHLLSGVVRAGTLGDIVRDGVLGAGAASVQREYEVWFLVAGVALLALGTLGRWAVRETGRLPRQVGVYLLALGAPVAVLWPVSGGILLVAVGALALVAARAPATPVADRTVHRGAAL